MPLLCEAVKNAAETGMKLLRPQRHKRGHSSNSPSYAETCSNKLEAMRKQQDCPEVPDTAYATKAAKRTCNNINNFEHVQ